MYCIHHDVQQGRIVIKDRDGKVFATRKYPDPTLPMLQGDNLKAYQDTLRLVKLANLGLKTLDGAETEIMRLESLIDGF